MSHSPRKHSQLKQWKEALQNQEARKNLGAIEEALSAGYASTGEKGFQPFAAVQGLDRLLKW